MDKIFTITENGNSVRIEIPDDTPRFAADGFGPALFGFPNTTLSLFQAQMGDPTDKVQDRKVVAQFTIPTVTILELAANIQKTLQDNKVGVQGALDQVNEIIARKL